MFESLHSYKQTIGFGLKNIGKFIFSLNKYLIQIEFKHKDISW